jgi:transcriptional regulator with XRE-family HTH domain
LNNYWHEKIGFKIRSIRNQLGLDQQEFCNEFQIPRYDIERFEEGLEMPSEMALAYLSAISADPRRVLDAVHAKKIFELTPDEDQSFHELQAKKIDHALAHEGGRDPDDKILWVGNNDGRLPKDEHRVRYPPRKAVNPCLVRCLYCKNFIDVPFEVLELHDKDNESVYDIDCPHCWQCNPITARLTVQKLVRFRKKCWEWINPPIAKSGRVSTSLRFKVLERDNFRCYYCGATPQQSALHVDHKVPINDGGTNALENLVAACAECNLGKGNRAIQEQD